MPKTRILLASVLKPVTDTRMFEKLGLSLAKLPETEIHLIGQATVLPKATKEIVFHPVFSFRRLSFKRLAAQWKYYKTIRKVKPEIIILTTPELLPVTILFKVLFKTEICYDVQENYFNNITRQNTYPVWLRPILGQGIQLLEKLSNRFISHYFLAERSYANELTFLNNNYTVLENKYLETTPNANLGTTPNAKPKAFPVRIEVSKPINLLYSGTISEVYGIWEAIDLAEKLYRLNSNICLTIIGYCAQETTLKKLQLYITGKPFITLIGGSTLVPYPEIRKAILVADMGLLPYWPNPSTANCIPTKLYEYQANALPVLIPGNPLWEEIVFKTDAGFTIDYFQPDAAFFLNQLEKRTFYARGIPEDVFWSSEEAKLLKVVQIKFHKILTNKLISRNKNLF